MNIIETKHTNANNITFEYEFTSKSESISNKQRADVPSILAVEALFIIKINNERYFEAELAILEFYKALFEWKTKVRDDFVPEFHYYTIEYGEYEDGALISLWPFSHQAKVTSIWAEADLHNVFEKDDVVAAFCALEQRLREDIEGYFHIDLKYFLQHIPEHIPYFDDEEAT
ncbi:hypothetical protein NSQ26_11950 [Bacillus sp. FSL W7-1360]